MVSPCNDRNRCLTSTRFRLVKCPASSPAINSSAVASRSDGSTVPWANTCVKRTTTKALTTNQADTMMVRDRLRRLIVLYMLSRRHASAVLHGSVHAAGILRGQHKTSLSVSRTGRSHMCTVELVADVSIPLLWNAVPRRDASVLWDEAENYSSHYDVASILPRLVQCICHYPE
jgi:hypothetical protein